MKKRLYWLLFVFILFLAALPRMIELISHNYLFGFDQGLFYQSVKSIVADRKFTLIGIEGGGNGGLFQGPGWLYLLAIPFWLTSGDPYGGMVLMFLLSMAAVALSMWWVSRAYDAVTGLIVGFMVAISPALISQARFIWSPFPVTILTVLLLLFLYKVFDKKGAYLAGAVAVLVTMYHFEVATFGTWLLANFPVVIYLFVKKLIKVKNILVSAFWAGILISPMILFDLRHNFLMVRGLGRLLGVGNPEHKATWLFTKTMYINHWAIFRGSFDSAFIWGPKFMALAYVFLLFGSLIYFSDKKVNRAQKRFLGYLIVTPYLLFIVFLLYRWPIWEWWILQLVVINCFLLGILLSYFWHRSKTGRLAVAILLIVFIGVHIQKTIHFYRVDFPDYGGVHKISGKLDALDTLFTDAGGEPFNLLVFTPPIYTYAYDYLSWWYGRNKYGFIPGKEINGLLYLLIEPDPEKPWSYQGWLETVVKQGSVERRWELPSGFIIERRRVDPI